MASTFAGIGTKFYVDKRYGKKKTDQKKSYTATKWIVFLYIPILPIGSFRTDHNFVRKVPLQWLHVCKVYASLIAIAFFARFIFSLQKTELADTTSPLSEVSSVEPSLKVVEPSLKVVEPDSKAPSPKTVEPAYQRLTTAENGTPFPDASGYIEGYEPAFTNGRSLLNVDNTKNNYDIYLKLYNLDVTPAGLASVFFVKAGDQFTVEQISSGSYELRYRNLDTGNQFRTETLTFAESSDPSSGAFTFTELTVKLYGVVNGNMNTYPITEENF